MSIFPKEMSTADQGIERIGARVCSGITVVIRLMLNGLILISVNHDNQCNQRSIWFLDLFTPPHQFVKSPEPNYIVIN